VTDERAETDIAGRNTARRDADQRERATEFFRLVL
jgi:hypothetical protein